MRALPIIIVVVLLAGIGYLLRNSVSGLFTGTTDKSDTQTVVLRQTATPVATPSPTPVATATAIPPQSIVNLNSRTTPLAVSTNLPAAGPADNLVAAAVAASLLVGGYRLIIRKSVVKAKIDIL